mgnify:CR=1 FL=1|jgi:hypothetical protein
MQHDKTEIGAMAFAAIGKKSLEKLRNHLRPDLTDDMYLLGLAMMVSIMAGENVQRLSEAVAVFAEDRASDQPAFMAMLEAFSDVEKKAPSL